MEQNQREQETKVIKIKKPKTTTVVIVLLLIISVFSLLWVSSMKKELKNAKDQVRLENPSQKNLDFALLFINKVLQNDKEVDFDTRLQLENAVRDLNDKDILFQWQQFTSAKDEKSAQMEAKNLLKLILEKAKG